MERNIIIAIFFIAWGAITLFYAQKALRDPDFARRYIETSPKAWLWRKLFGVEKTIKMTRKFFAPLGCIASVLFILCGIFFLIDAYFGF